MGAALLPGREAVHQRPQRRATSDDPYAALFVALIGEGPRPQGVVQSIGGRVVRAFHRFTLVDQSGNTPSRDITKGRQRDQGAVKISCARQDPNARNCHGYRKFVRRSVLEAPNNGYLVDDTIVIRYEIELVVTSGGALNRANKQYPMSIDVSSFPTLGDQIKDLLTEDADKTDCVFEVEGVRFPAHSLVLAARSSTFRAMLRTGAEMREGSEGVVRLRDIRAGVQDPPRIYLQRRASGRDGTKHQPRAPTRRRSLPSSSRGLRGTGRWAGVTPRRAAMRRASERRRRRSWTCP